MDSSESMVVRGMRSARELAEWVRSRLGDIVLVARVFGSVARADATEDSDVDLFLLVSRRLTREEKLEVGGAAFDIDMRNGTWTGWMVETASRWAMPVVHEGGVAQAIREEGVPV